MSEYTVQSGSKLVLKGCVWNAQWEFDCPVVIYSPVCCYNPNGASISKDAVLDLMEDICCDLASGLSFPMEWSESDKREFNWRGWSLNGFARRKKAYHVHAIARFFDNKESECLDYTLEMITGIER